jgi:hypothetical protein
VSGSSAVPFDFAYSSDYIICQNVKKLFVICCSLFVDRTELPANYSEPDMPRAFFPFEKQITDNHERFLSLIAAPEDNIPCAG